MQSLTPPTPVPTPVPGQAAGSLCSRIQEHVRAALQVGLRQSSRFQPGHTRDKDKETVSLSGRRTGHQVEWGDALAVIPLFRLCV